MFSDCFDASQREIYQGKLNDGSNVASAILRNAGALPRYSALVLGKGSRKSVMEPESADVAGESARDISLKFHPVLKSMKYLPGDGKDDTVKKVLCRNGSNHDIEKLEFPPQIRSHLFIS
jgi:hypothetical protein